MQKCKSCKNRIDAFYIICPECGAPLVENIEFFGKLKNHLHINDYNNKFDRLRKDYTELDIRKERLNNNKEWGHPTESGLYPHEIVVLSELNYLIRNVQTRMYRFFFAMDVIDVQEILDSLEDRGFIIIDYPLSMQQVSLEYLKEILAPHGITGQGKAEMARQAIELIPIEELALLFPVQYYSLTEKGKKELKSDKYVVKIRRDDDSLDVWKANRAIHKYPDLTFEKLKNKSYMCKLCHRPTRTGNDICSKCENDNDTPYYGYQGDNSSRSSSGSADKQDCGTGCWVLIIALVVSIAIVCFIVRC